jgi:16S rRNA (guanine527-N7)-methyltransferase
VRGQREYVLRRQLAAWNLEVDDQRIDKLLQYSGLLATHRSANVIGTRDLDVVVRDHVLDSLSCLQVIGEAHPRQVLDIGSGGGLPGLALALALESVRFTLLEATGKKVEFLRQAVKQLEANNVEILHGRAEVLAKDEAYRDRFDVVTARALASLPVLLEYSAPFLRLDGLLVAMKGRVVEGEIDQAARSARLLRMARRKVVRVEAAEASVSKERHLVVFAKEGETPEGFPRREGMATKRPLGGS